MATTATRLLPMSKGALRGVSGLRPIRARPGHLRPRFRWSVRYRETASGAVNAGSPKWTPKLAALLAYEQVKLQRERSVRPSAQADCQVPSRAAPPRFCLHPSIGEDCPYGFKGARHAPRAVWRVISQAGAPWRAT